MGQLFHCQCSNCNHRFDIRQGGGFSFYERYCDGCGKSITLPRHAPRPNRASRIIPRPLLRDSDMPGQPGRENAVLRDDGSVFFPGIENENIQRFTHEEIKTFLEGTRWPRGGDQWDDDEIELIKKIQGDCNCGGNWVEPERNEGHKPHSLHRCPQCRSKEYAYQDSGIVSD